VRVEKEGSVLEAWIRERSQPRAFRVPAPGARHGAPGAAQIVPPSQLHKAPTPYGPAAPEARIDQRHAATPARAEVTTDGLVAEGLVRYYGSFASARLWVSLEITQISIG